MEKTKAKDKAKLSESWIKPGGKISQEEFLKGIQKAEEGPFYSISESIEHFESWLKSKEKK